MAALDLIPGGAGFSPVLVGSGGGAPQAPAPASPAGRTWQRRAERLTASATRAACILADVLEAEYTITGTPDAAELHVRVVLADGADTSRTVQTLTEDMVHTLEGLLGTGFAARHATVDTAARPVVSLSA